MISLSKMEGVNRVSTTPMTLKGESRPKRMEEILFMHKTTGVEEAC